MGKHSHSFEGEVFGVRGNDMFDAFSITQSNVRAGFVEVEEGCVFERFVWGILR